MAKQVAHEIKNPLTHRLTVQSFQRKFDPTDPNVKQK
jgi:nitrogen fixation/metabolism regulation signal transduction histidine kinase